MAQILNQPKGSCYWLELKKDSTSTLNLISFLFPFDPLLVWHEAGVILFVSAGGSEFKTTMTEQASTQGENTTVQMCLWPVHVVACVFMSGLDSMYGCISLGVCTEFCAHSNIFVCSSIMCVVLAKLLALHACSAWHSIISCQVNFILARLQPFFNPKRENEIHWAHCHHEHHFAYACHKCLTMRNFLHVSLILKVWIMLFTERERE